MAHDAEHYDGFDKYGPVGRPLGTGDLAGDWTSFAAITNLSVATSLTPSISSPGRAVYMDNNNQSGDRLLFANFGTDYARSRGSVVMLHNPSMQSGVQKAGPMFLDGGTPQLSIVFNTLGQIEVVRGSPNGGVLIATSSETFTVPSVHVLSWDVTFHNSAGEYHIWLDGVMTSLSATGVDTCATLNNRFSSFGFWLRGSFTNRLTVDHYAQRMYLSAGTDESADDFVTNNVIIETQFASGDEAVEFDFGAGVGGNYLRYGAATNAPGANRLLLVPFTPETDCTIGGVSMHPGTTSATVKLKAVLYADNAGSPAGGALLDTGAEAVGTASSVIRNSDFPAPVALSAGTTYWIGFVVDTALTWAVSNVGSNGYSAAHTYVSGPPGTAPAMTGGQAGWQIFCTLVSSAESWPLVNNNPQLGAASYLSSATVGDEDTFTFDPLSSTPQKIYGSAIKAFMAKTDAGGRTVDIIQKSGGAEGVTASQGLATTFGYLPHYQAVDPNTGLAWNAADLNAATGGFRIAS